MNRRASELSCLNLLFFYILRDGIHLFTLSVHTFPPETKWQLDIQVQLLAEGQGEYEYTFWGLRLFSQVSYVIHTDDTHTPA